MTWQTEQWTLVVRWAGVVMTRQGRWRMSLAPLPAAGVAAALLQVPRVDSDGVTRAPAPALACVMGVTGEGRDGKAVVVLIALVLGEGVKTNIN
jgi:hypothetical protein